MNNIAKTANKKSREDFACCSCVYLENIHIFFSTVADMSIKILASPITLRSSPKKSQFQGLLHVSTSAGNLMVAVVDYLVCQFKLSTQGDYKVTTPSIFFIFHSEHNTSNMTDTTRCSFLKEGVKRLEKLLLQLFWLRLSLGCSR